MGELDATNVKAGFKRGIVQLRKCDYNKAREELANALGISIRSLPNYINGKVEPKASQAISIEKTFIKFGVTKDIWGE